MVDKYIRPFSLKTATRVGAGRPPMKNGRGGTIKSESTRRIKSNRAAGALCLRNRTYRAASAGALGVLLATTSSVAVAQTAPATSPQAAPAAPAQAAPLADKNADIIVTAQRRK